MRRTAAGLLALLFIIAAWDALWAFGVFFVMSNAEGAIADNSSWLFCGPFSFLPALILGLLCVSLCRIEEVSRFGRVGMWLPATWLLYGATRFTWLDFFGKGFASRGSHLFHVLVVPVPMLVAACCIWVFRYTIDVTGTLAESEL